MPETTQAEQFLLEQIRQGSEEGWSQLVERYQGRLTSFARRRLPAGTDAEDLVQETFLRFLRALKDFRGQASVETYLFMILRRQIVDLFRGRRIDACQIAESTGGNDAAPEPLAPDPSASSYARRDEQRDAARAALTTALRTLVRGLQDDLSFRDLQVLEMVFYAQRPNRAIAALLQMRPEHIALIKHRWVKQVRERVQPLLLHAVGSADALPEPEALDSLLTEIWETERLSCPKRSTIGGYVLGTLDPPWHDYVQFHVTVLGCTFCRANLDDLQKQTAQDPRALRDRIIQSTVGFFRRT